jgi:hypothetical protein
MRRPDPVWAAILSAGLSVLLSARSVSTQTILALTAEQIRAFTAEAVAEGKGDPYLFMTVLDDKVEKAIGPF